jgi:hypothetical protein
VKPREAAIGFIKARLTSIPVSFDGSAMPSGVDHGMAAADLPTARGHQPAFPGLPSPRRNLGRKLLQGAPFGPQPGASICPAVIPFPRGLFLRNNPPPVAFGLPWRAPRPGVPNIAPLRSRPSPDARAGLFLTTPSPASG